MHQVECKSQLYACWATSIIRQILSARDIHPDKSNKTWTLQYCLVNLSARIVFALEFQGPIPI